MIIYDIIKKINDWRKSMTQQIKRAISELPHGKNYYIERRSIRAGTYFAPHWHDYFEFEIILEGEGEHIYNHECYTLKRGDAYLMSYYDFHELRAKTDILLLKIQFDEQLLPKELNDFIFLSKNRFCCSCSSEDTAAIISMMELVEQEELEHQLFRELIIRNLLTSVIVRFLRNVESIQQPSLPGLLQKAVVYIHNHFREDLSLPMLAEHCAVTPNYLGTLFSKWMETSFSDYLNTVRLRHACNLLSSTVLPIKEIAFASGYHSVEHFEYIFKKNLSCTPTAFRKAGRATQP